MLQQIRQRWHDYRLTRAATKVVTAGEGYAARTWPVPGRNADWPEVHTTITDWLALQLSGTATPYGFSRYRIGLGLAALHGDQRTPLWSELLPAFTRSETSQGLAALGDRLHTLPLAEYPTATHVEVYVLSLGDILKQSYERLGYE